MSESLPLAGSSAPGAQGSVTPSSAPRRSGFLAVLRNRSFLAIWLAQVASQTAQNALWYALIIMVADVTGRKPAGVGFTIILVQLPTVLFSGISGVFVDRVSKRWVLIGTNVLRVFGALLYVVFQTNVAGLYLVTFLVAVISQPFAPAEGSTLPLLVEGDELITANSLFQMTFMASQGAGFALSPIAIGVFGLRPTLIAIAVLFALSAAVLTLLPASTNRHLPTRELSVRDLAKRLLADLVEVFRFIWGDPPLAIALFQIALAPTLLLILAEVGPDFLSNTLGIGQTSTGLFFLLAPAGVGIGIGMFVLGHWGARLRKERLVLVSLIALGVTVIGLAAVPVLGTFWQSLENIGINIPDGVRLTLTMAPIAALMGLAVAFINAPVQTIVQERAAPELRGRVLAMQQTLTAAIAIPPLVLVGGVAVIFGTPATLTLMGVAIIVIGLGIVYYS